MSEKAKFDLGRWWQRSLIIFCLILGHWTGCHRLMANPFFIPFPPKETVSNDDFIYIQEQLRAIDIQPMLKELYPHDPNYTGYEDFYARCARGIRQTLIDPAHGKFPRMHLEQIGEKSDRCFVTCVPFKEVYVDLVTRLPAKLKKVGFNGFLLYSIGGFPNPTGREIQYVGVPYCFKIFMMLEAYKRGFNEVIWIDAAALPLRNPKPLFEWLNKNEVFLMGKASQDAGRYVLPATRELLKDLTGTDVLNVQFIRSIVFGLKMNSPKVQKLIETYYEFVELGTPFLSCYPEEFVLTAIIGQPEFKHWKPQPFKLLAVSSKPINRCILKKAKKEGFFFFHLKH